MIINKSFEFDAAHRLMHHDGNCSSIHGHRYRVDIQVEGRPDSRGMIVDFGKLKQCITDKLDHALILNREDPIFLKFCDVNFKILCLNGEPTAENLASEIWHMLFDQLEIKCEFVTVWETPTSSATFLRGEVQ